MLAGTCVGFLLAGCSAATGTGEQKFTAPPIQTQVLQGTVTGLGTRRPVVLQYNGNDTCEQTADPNSPSGQQMAGECRFLGVLNADNNRTAFSFGAIAVGTPYNITVKKQPFGSLCTVSNGIGTVGASGNGPVTIACVKDPAVPRYAISGSISVAASTLPGLQVILTTEEGVFVQQLTGATSFTFPDAVFDSGQSLPVFGWSVTATIPPVSPGGPVNNCNVSGGPVANTGGNIGADGAPVAAPTGNVSGVQVTACTFTVAVRADAAAGGPATLGDGLVVAIRNHHTGKDLQSVPITTFGAAGMGTFPGVLSNADAIYELVVKSQPAGQACLPGFGSGVPGSTLTDAGAVLLLRPSSATVPGSWVINRSLRCRAVPSVAARLKGTYQQTTPDTTAPASRNFITFFENGTYVYGAHANAESSSGLEHGFYNLDPVAATITFQPYVDTSGPGGMSANGAAVTLADFARISTTPAQISGTLGTASWLLTEVDSIPGHLEGAWITADQRRIFIYDSGYYRGFHVGVNGMGNVQDACFVTENIAASSGEWVRQGARVGCVMGPGLGSLDVPNPTTSPPLPPGFRGRWPQSMDVDYNRGRPYSPIHYELHAGEPDRLSVWDTENGIRIGEPIVLYRTTAQ